MSNPLTILAFLSLTVSLHAATLVSGTITTDTTWNLAGSPYIATNQVFVATAATLTIDPGVTVQFTNGIGLSIRGRLLAEGNSSNRIVFTRVPTGTNWSRINFTNNASESRITFADLAYGIRSTGDGTILGNNTTLYLESVVWTNITGQLLDMNNGSIKLINCVLPTVNTAELYHHTGLPTNGYAILIGNTFGSSGGGVNDVIDFTGGQRPGAIVQLYSNVFLGGTDDALDFDGTDAHIENNIFMNFHASGGPGASDTASAISGGRNGALTSRITIARNLIYDCDYGILCKETNFYVIQNNTFVKMLGAAVNFDEPLRSGVTPGMGMIFEGNIVWNTQNNFSNVYVNDPIEGTTSFTVNYNILSGTDYTNKGVGNLVTNPLLTGTNGVTADNIRTLFELLTNSPAIGTGPNGLDRGALVPAGASISGEPNSTTTNTSALLPIAGPGIVAYQWRTNNGPWSSFVQLTNSLAYKTNLFTNAAPITLSNLAAGTYTVYVLGMNSAGALQDTNALTVSKTWTVQVSTDSDGDGMPDAWEQANGTNPNSNDAASDLDTDGLTNLQEYWAGTSPTNAASVLLLNVASMSGGNVLLSFDAISNRAYGIEARVAIDAGLWTNLLGITSSTTNRFINVTNPIVPQQQFYRLRAQPE